MAWSVWVDLFIRSALLIGASQMLMHACARLGPAYRHKLLLLGFGFLAILPLASALLPAVRIPVWLSHADRATVSIETISFTGTDGPDTANTSPLEVWLLRMWLAGVVAAILFAVCGRVVLWRMRRRAVPIRDAAWKELLHEFCSRLAIEKEPQLLRVPGLSLPLVFGIRHPRILLPGDCMEWTDLRRRVVLLHELAHIRRRDIAAQLFASATAAIWWFQPLVWVARRSLRRESEQACDAEAVSAGVRASDYAAELVEIARNATTDRLWSRAAIAMARPRDLEGRLVRILNPCSRVRARRYSLTAIAALSGIAFTASALTLSSQQRIPNLRGLLMKRNLISGLATSAALSAATITGSVFDPSGVAISDAKVSLSEPDTSLKQATTSTANGKFSFDGLPAGQYILRIEKPGYVALLREFTLRQSSNVDRGFNMQLPPSQIDVQAKGKEAEAMPQSGETKRLRVRGEFMESKLVNKVQPVYPVSAKAAGIQGTVLLETVVLKDGTAGEITVLSSPNEDLSQASLEAVRQWRWSSTLLNGQPIEVMTEVIINFTLAP